MQLFWRLALTTAVVIGFAFPRAPPAVAQSAGGDRCFAVTMQGIGQIHLGSGKSRQEATIDAMSKCILSAKFPETCQILDQAYCNIAQGALSDGCFAVTMQNSGQIHLGHGKSLQEATADALSKCRAIARNQNTCRIVDRAYCNIAPKPEATSNHPFIDRVRQTKIPINWWSILTAGGIHLLWLWHIISQKMLPAPTKAGLSVGVLAIQSLLAYVLGSDGDIALLEVPIFALPLGFGDLVANFSIKHRSK